MNVASDLLARHPAADVLRRLFPGQSDASARSQPRVAYLPLLAGNVDFFRQHQSAEGAIIDPYENAERQYSTPAFALAAATLVAHAGRNDLLGPATRAFGWALAALAGKTTASNHPDFYIPLLVHAFRLLGPRVSPDTSAGWREQFAGLVPGETYRFTAGVGNWNLVNVAGECLRRKDGLVAGNEKRAQTAYIERCVETQLADFTPFGMYRDPNEPLAYDAFPRLWLDDVLADGAYDSGAQHHAALEAMLTLGGLSTLLLLSPAGEWACGGRSAHHQWNEAQVCVIAEVNAVRWAAWGRLDIAHAFKRAARLALGSMARWQRPSGELFIVKNRADPARRHGYENYSFHSQYNLLAVAMLALAYARADDTLAERPLPAETGSYVFDARATFHKVAAAAGGTYVLVDTQADPHYNASGLLRVHCAGVPGSPLSDNAAAHRHYGPSGDTPRRALGTGLQWKKGSEETAFRSLANFHHGRYAGKYGDTVVAGVVLNVSNETPERAVFSVHYELGGEPAAQALEETYTLTAGEVEVTTRLVGGEPDLVLRVGVPVLVSDGADDTNVAFEGSVVRVSHAGATLTAEVISPARSAFGWDADFSPVPTRNGFVRSVVANLPPGTTEARWRLRLA